MFIAVPRYRGRQTAERNVLVLASQLPTYAMSYTACERFTSEDEVASQTLPIAFGQNGKNPGISAEMPKWHHNAREETNTYPATKNPIAEVYKILGKVCLVCM